jgi:hypothetical protein
VHEAVNSPLPEDRASPNPRDGQPVGPQSRGHSRYAHPSRVKGRLAAARHATPDQQARSVDLSRMLLPFLPSNRAWMERAERTRRRYLWWM